MITTILTIATFILMIGFYVKDNNQDRLKANIRGLQKKLKSVEAKYYLQIEETKKAELDALEDNREMLKLQEEHIELIKKYKELEATEEKLKEKVDLEVSKRLSEIREEFKDALDKIGKPFIKAETYPTTLENKIYVVQGVYIKSDGQVKINSEAIGFVDLKEACFDFESYKKTLVDGVKYMINRNDRYRKIDENGEFVKKL